MNTSACWPLASASFEGGDRYSELRCSVVRLLTLIRTVLALGVLNCARVVVYRAAMRARIFEWLTPSTHLAPLGNDWLALVAFAPHDSMLNAQAVIQEADLLLSGRMRYFGRHVFETGAPPQWCRDPSSGVAWPDERHWSRVDEFGSKAADIKLVWEASRFTWILAFVQAERVSGDPRYRAAGAAWLDSWIAANPVNVGPNWKCGQETSIRLMHLLTALHLIGPQGPVAEPIAQFVMEHLRRIRATLFYAQAQDNNHATSEAAALVIGADWLIAGGSHGAIASFAHEMAILGRRILNETIMRLIAADGTFSQYSTNYHRLVLDTLSLVEWSCRTLGTSGLGLASRARVQAAIDWLASVVDADSGGAPNLGGNDGALILPLACTDYRDFRSTLQLAAALFRGERLYPPGPWDAACEWLGVALPRAFALRSRTPTLYPSGFVVIAAPQTRVWALLRLPTFRFRPSHADALHLDVWVAGVNLMRDAGSFSYNCGEPWQSYFSSTRAHCTCEFDGRNQMPRLGRFLFGDWLEQQAAAQITHAGTAVGYQAMYRDRWGACHHRSVRLSDGVVTVVDKMSGHSERAVLRWRLLPGEWQLNGNELRGEHAIVRISCDAKAVRIAMVDEWESRYYMERTVLPTLQIELARGAATVETVIEPVGA